MAFIVSALALLVLSGLGALILKDVPRLAGRIAVGGTCMACGLGLIPAAVSLAYGTTFTLALPWAVPFGAFHIVIDPLSAFFLLPLFILSPLAAVYGLEYLEHGRDQKSVGGAWFFTNLLVASMILVIISRNAVLFLSAWEVMTLASFFLVTFEDEKSDVRRAGMIYLVATHVGTACLLALFVLLGHGSGTLDFDLFSVEGIFLPSVVFILAVIGFGTKAGFIPLHVWLPEAHPAAPSHVSALMSGVMIKLGIYGLVRTLTFLGTPPIWWGWLMVAIGITSGILGVVFALAQHDLKRLLAYHSVENIGIIALGMGIGLLGMSLGLPLLAILAWAGALLHVLNHALFKGLLFLGAGAVLNATGTRDIDHLGGLLRRMPSTGVCFLVGAAAICGLPPLNGFVSEFLIYLAAFHGVLDGLPVLITSLAVIAALATIGGLASACFAKAFGVVFLGEPRTEAAACAREAGEAMRIPMAILVAGCAAIGLFAPFVLGLFNYILPEMVGLPQGLVEEYLDRGRDMLFPVMGAAWGLAAFVGAFWYLRRRLLGKRLIGESVTWDCGYAAPSPRMQYTGSSFAQPLVRFFKTILRSRRDFKPPEGYFPKETHFSTETPDVFLEKFYGPVFLNFDRYISGWRWIQHGNLQLYILYIVGTLLMLLVWIFW